MSHHMKFLDEALDNLRKNKIFRELTVIEGAQGPRVKIGGKEVINLSSNNYLGLNTHPKLKEAALKAIEKYGVGSGAVRTIAGTLDIHKKSEERIAEFKKTEAVVLFQSGGLANQGTIQSIMGKDDVIFSDEFNHASIIDGCRLSRAEIKVYPHKDMGVLENLLKEYKGTGKKLIVSDGVFSMDGDICPLPNIAELGEKYEAITMVDDAHASGVLGKNGRGTVDHFNLHGRIDIQMGTLSKAIGCMGGYIAGSKSLRDYLIHFSRPFLFSTSHPPSVPASILAAIDVLENEPEILDTLWSNVNFFKGELKNLGFDTGISETPITPVIVGEASIAVKMSDRLLEEAIFGQSISFPTVPRGKARIRTIVTAAHTKDDLSIALEKFEKVGKELAII
ncbi:MAG: glycine C-acetyltransferase [Actinobacteria bacterium]|nr:glycine C-acetyltransferase [Actinomycetota bacterium]